MPRKKPKKPKKKDGSLVAQFARPNSDISLGAWSNPSWSVIDEVTPDDGDFTSTDTPSELIVGLSSVTDPEVSTGHVVRIRARSINGSGGPERCNFELYQGETLIRTSGNNSVDRNAFTEYSFTLIDTEADAITNYGDLRLKFISTQAGGETVAVSWAELEVPDAPAGGYTIVCNQGSYALSGQVTGLFADRKLAIAQGSYSLAGQVVGLLVDRLIAIAQGAYSLAGQSANLTTDRLLAFAQGSYSIAGQAVIFAKGFTMAADQGGYTLTGQSVTFPITRRMAVAQGSYTLSGQAVNLLGARMIALSQGTFALSGQFTGLLVGRAVVISQGSYTLTGIAVDLIYTPIGGYTIVVDQGSYALAGQSAGLLATRKLAIEQGSYAITGQAAGLLRGFVLPASQGAYILTGQSAALLIARTLALAQGSYALTGMAVGLNVSGMVVALIILTLNDRNAATSLDTRSTVFTLQD